MLHSFTHLGGENAAPEFAQALIEDLAARLARDRLSVWIYPVRLLQRVGSERVRGEPGQGVEADLNLSR